MYLTFEEYCMMGGTLQRAEFARFSAKAENRLNLETHSRVQDELPVRESVQRAVFDLIGAMASLEGDNAALGGAVSYSNDGLSVSYGSATDARRARSVRYRSILTEWLADEVTSDGVPLMYAGVDR